MKNLLFLFIIIWGHFTFFAQPIELSTNLQLADTKRINQIQFFQKNNPIGPKIKYQEIKKILKKDLVLQFYSTQDINTIWDTLSILGKDPNGLYNYSKEKYVKLVLYISRYPDQMIAIPFHVSIDSTISKPFSFEIPFYLNQKDETYREMAYIFKKLLKNPKSQILTFNFYIHILPKDSSNSYGIPLGSTSFLVNNEEPKKIKWEKHQQGEIIRPKLFDKIFKREKPIQVNNIDTIYPVLNNKIYRKIKQQFPSYKLKLHPREDVRYQFLNHPHYDPDILDSLNKDDKLYYGAGYQIIKQSRSGRKFTKGYVYIAISELPEYESCLFYFDAITCRFLYAIRLVPVPG